MVLFYFMFAEEKKNERNDCNDKSARASTNQE